MSVNVNANQAVPQDAKATAQKAAVTAGKAAALAAAVAVGGAAGAAVVAAGEAVRSALDALDSSQLKSIGEQLKRILEQSQGEKMVDDGLREIVDAGKAYDESTVFGKPVAFLQLMAARIKFHEQVRKASTGENRAARDHALEIMAEPNGRRTEGTLKFMLDTINKELDRRGDAIKVLPIPVPFPLPFCGTTTIPFSKH